MGSKGGGGGVDTDVLEQNNARNIAFQKQTYDQAKALASPYNEVGFQALNSLAALSGLDTIQNKPNYTGSFDDPRFADTGTVAERITALGSAPSQTMTVSTGPTMRKVMLSNEGGDGGSWTYEPTGRSGTKTVANPAYADYMQRVAGIRQSGDIQGQPTGPELKQTTMDNFFNSPEYTLTFQNALDESTKALSRSAAARGQLNSQATRNAIGDNAGQLANQTFGQFRNNLSQLAGFGTQGLQTTVNSGANAASQVGASLNNLNSSLVTNQQYNQQNSSGFDVGQALGIAAGFM